jgi:phosphoglycolate phosphatase
VAAATPAVAALVFDLDGTLIESRADLARAVNRLRGELGLPAHSLEAVTGMVGRGARELVRRAFEADRPELSPDALLPRFLELYDQVCLEETRLYAGLEAALDTLGSRLPLAVLTNKPEAIARKILRALGSGERFATVVGGDTLPTRKPDPAGLALVGARLGVPTTALVLVGDTPIDAATARAADCPAVLVGWGFVALERLRQEPAAAWIARTDELVPTIEALAQGGAGRSSAPDSTNPAQ